MFRWIKTKNKIHLLQKARFISHNRYINTLLKKDLFWKSVFLFWKPVPKTSFTTPFYKHSTNIIPYRKCFTFHNERPDLKLLHFTFRDCYFLRITQNRQTSMVYLIHKLNQTRVVIRKKPGWPIQLVLERCTNDYLGRIKFDN